ncbi:MAG: response regulator [Eubacteriales bacterium]
MENANIFTIVVAEDEELLLNNLIQKIENTKLNFKIIGKAQTGKTALKLVEELSPDILITDIKMPVMTGLELIEQVYQQFPFIKSIIVSGFSDFSYAKTALKFGVSNYLLKPIDPDELYQTLESLSITLTSKKHSYDNFCGISASIKSPAQLAKLLYEYILENYKEKINLNLIAADLGYNSNHLTKIFSDVYNNTPNKFIISLRIQEAQNLLVHNPELSIGQIGEYIGYPDPGYFSRIFKKQTGLSPFDYREQQNDYRHS